LVRYIDTKDLTDLSLKINDRRIESV